MHGPVRRNALQPSCMLHWYRIERLLGQGNFGVTYVARDTNLDQPVAIKEYLPAELAIRDPDGRVRPASEAKCEQFRWGLERFISEAQTLAQFDHPNIVRVYAVFEANDTAYMVMPYEQGATLQGVFALRSRLREDELGGLIAPLLDALDVVHRAGFIHRDIKPGNVFLRADGTPVLIDFGSARQALGEAKQNLTALVSPGYAPLEQYSSRSDNQGPCTDIYSLAATLYRCVAGAPPVDAAERGQRITKGEADPLVPAARAAAGRYSASLLRAIDRGLAFKASERPQSVAAWRAHFHLPKAAGSEPTEWAATEPAGAELAECATVPLWEEAPPTRLSPRTAADAPPQPRARAWRRRLPFAALLAVATALAGGAAWQLHGHGGDGTLPVDSMTPASHVATATAAPAAIEPAPRAGSERALQRLLALAEEAFARGRVTAPPRDNARYYYRRVLESDPGNARASRGLARVAAWYETLAERHRDKGDYVAAADYVALGLEVDPDAARLRALQAELETQARVRELLGLARRALEEYRLTTPAGDSALHYYEQALALDPDNWAARAGRSKIATAYLGLAQARAEQRDDDTAREFVRRGLEVQPGHAGLLALREGLAGQASRAREAPRQRGEPSVRAESGGEDRKVSFTQRLAETLREIFDSSRDAEPRRFEK